MRVSVIAAASENNVIGNKGKLPWDLPDDLKMFKERTLHHPVIMGRKTFESLPGGALPDRENIIVTHERGYKADGCETASSLDEAIMFAHRNSDKEEVFIIDFDKCKYRHGRRWKKNNINRLNRSINKQENNAEIILGQIKEGYQS